MTLQSLESMLERMGVNTRSAANFDTKNVAAVMVTADLPAFTAAGGQIDVTVAAMGDAKSLQGGTLLVTPLLGADGEAYAVAQGTIETGSISASGASGSSVSRGVPTAGRIAAGASVEREVGFKLDSMAQLRLSLRNPDFTTAQRIADVINAHYPGTAAPENPTIVTVRPPAGQDMMSFITSLEDLEVEPEAPAKVVIDEDAGVIVMGEDVRVSTVAIAQGNLTISVQESPTVSQPAPFSQGTTQVTPNSKAVRTISSLVISSHMLVRKPADIDQRPKASNITSKRLSSRPNWRFDSMASSGGISSNWLIMRKSPSLARFKCRARSSAARDWSILTGTDCGPPAM